MSGRFFVAVRHTIEMENGIFTFKGSIVFCCERISGGMKKNMQLAESSKFMAEIMWFCEK